MFLEFYTIRRVLLGLWMREVRCRRHLAAPGHIGDIRAYQDRVQQYLKRTQRGIVALRGYTDCLEPLQWVVGCVLQGLFA